MNAAATASIIKVEFERGEIARFVTSNPALSHLRFAEFHDGEPRRWHGLDHTDEDQITAAVVALREEQQLYGLGLACEAVADALRELSATPFDTAREMLAKIESVMAVFVRQVQTAMAA